MRKTSIVLHALSTLMETGQARKALVVAPKKVCQLVWRQEGAKWAEFRHLSFTFLHGPKKAKLLADDADIHLINPEGVAWLAKQYLKCPDKWPYDTVIFDEITKFKNSQSERSKALRGRSVQGVLTPNLLKRSQRRWGMTGTPNPNGYMDLFGQFLMLDDGAAMGRFITHYRDQYFSCGFNGFDYDLQPGAEKRIQTRLEPYVFALDANDYLTLPELQDNIIELDLEPEAWAAYEAMRKDLVAQIGEELLEAANKATAYNKLSQMAGGAVYMEDGSVRELHSAKIDALSDLMEEMGDRQLLIGYEFNHEKDRIKARLGNRVTFLSDARTDAQAEEVQRDWNAGRIQFLACHPASAGHGLNLQEGGASHLCMFSPIWDLELWEQFVKRLLRSGTTAERVVRHILAVRNSIDELKLQALIEKDTSQSRLKRALTTVLSGEQTKSGDEPMVMKLQRAGAAAPAAEAGERRAPAGWGAKAGAPVEEVAQNTAPAEVAQNERKAPTGWGAKAGTTTAPTEEQEQRAEIREKLNPEVPAEVEGETSGFSADVIQMRGAIEAGEDTSVPFDGAQPRTETPAPKATRSRTVTKDTGPAQVIDLDAVREAVASAVKEAQASAPQPFARTDDEREGSQITELMYASKAAAEAVAALAPFNVDAAGATYELLFGAIEKRLQAMGYADAS